eukprot:3819699-Rhodomonas_salina.1
MPFLHHRQRAFPVRSNLGNKVLDYQRQQGGISLPRLQVLQPPRRPLERHVPNRAQQRLLVHRP